MMSVSSGSESEREMSKYGLELLYINAGLVMHCQESDDYDLLGRTIEMLESHDRNGTTMGRDGSLYYLLITCQSARRGGTTVRYPRSFHL